MIRDRMVAVFSFIKDIYESRTRKLDDRKSIDHYLLYRKI